MVRAQRNASSLQCVLASWCMRGGVALWRRHQWSRPQTGIAMLSPDPPFLQPSFAEMTTPALIVYGGQDYSHMTTRGPDWRADPYTLSPAPKCLLTIRGGEHSLGGIADFNAAETTDENPERVSTLQRFTLAYLQAVLYGTSAWADLSASHAADQSCLVETQCK